MQLTRFLAVLACITSGLIVTGTPTGLVDLTVAHLGIRLNEALLDHMSVEYGSKVDIEGLDTWNDAQLTKLAEMAYDGMTQARASMPKELVARIPKPLRAPSDLPKVMTLLVVDKTAYFASSIKGTGMGLYENDSVNWRKKLPKHPPSALCPDLVMQGLKACLSVDDSTDPPTQLGHQNGGACGEVMAVWAFCWKHPDATAASLAHKKIVAVGRKQGSTEMEIKKPCGTPNSQAAGQSQDQAAGMTGCYNFVYGKDYKGRPVPDGLSLAPISHGTASASCPRVPAALRPEVPDFFYKAT